MTPNPALLEKLKEYLGTRMRQISCDGQRLNLNCGACDTISRLACEILKGIDYECEVRRVAVLIGNEIGRKIFAEQAKTGNFNQEEQIKAGGCVIGMGVPPEMFHYIIWFPKEREILDLTFGQSSRPQYNIHTAAYWESINKLPEEILSFEFIDGVPETRAPLYDIPKLKPFFEDVIKKGMRYLKSACNPMKIQVP